MRTGKVGSYLGKYPALEVSIFLRIHVLPYHR